MSGHRLSLCCTLTAGCHEVFRTRRRLDGLVGACGITNPSPVSEKETSWGGLIWMVGGGLRLNGCRVAARGWANFVDEGYEAIGGDMAASKNLYISLRTREAVACMLVVASANFPAVSSTAFPNLRCPTKGLCALYICRVIRGRLTFLQLFGF